MALPLVALTMGDPAGIGPEIITRVAAMPDFAIAHRAFAIADPDRLAWEVTQNELVLEIETIDVPEGFTPKAGVLAVLPGPSVPSDLPYGGVDARAGSAAFGCLRQAIELANAGRVDAICTAPINKEALAAAGLNYPGHTEILAQLCGTPEAAMMLATPEMRVILVTIHCSLREAIERLTIETELRTIRLAHETLRRLGIVFPRIAVAGLNPHAGEAGLFGREDLDVIAPAIRAARSEGIEVSGPHPGDTVFMLARRGRYDIVVAQYHDQGLIPIKLMGVEHGVNITLGLPFVRTSPDHGTAFDIAGTGRADPRSMRRALDVARDMALQR